MPGCTALLKCFDRFMLGFAQASSSADAGKSSGQTHVLQGTSGSGSGRQTFNYSTDRVVGNGSFGVVFQATCLETGETVSSCLLSMAGTAQVHAPVDTDLEAGVACALG